MRIIPQSGGALLVQEPTPDIIYDMGNARLYAQCDATGRIVSAFVPEGLPLQTMRGIRYMVLNDDVVPEEIVATGSATMVARHLADQFKGTDSEGSGKRQKKMWTGSETQILHFETAQALGKTWMLSGQCADLTVVVTTFVDESSPALFQQIQATNHGTRSRVFALDTAVSLQFNRPYIGRGHANPHGDHGHDLNGGRIRSLLHHETQFDATLRPWQLVMDKSQMGLSYALPVRPGETKEFCLVTATCDDLIMDEYLSNWRNSLARAEAYNQKLMAYATDTDPLVQSLIVAGLNAGMTAYKELNSGVGGFLAGVSYAYPPRVYFRDSYWTAQAALIIQPELVRKNLLWLAQGISADGSCPSGVWNPGLFSAGELDIPDVLNWISDHYDSPSFFVILLHDYIKASGDVAILDETAHGRSLFQHAMTCMDYLISHDQDDDGLFEKPRAANDWADNVMRSDLVTYDLALFYHALTCLVWLSNQRAHLFEASEIQHYEIEAARVKTAINAHLWDEQLGYYRNYQREGFIETNFSIDTLLTILYGIADEKQTQRSLDFARRYLQTRNNREQIYGDWGVMCCYPFYHQKADLFSISAEEYRYHNGADWPYWDGVYGLILLERGDPDWHYVLTRWWEYGLEQGWLTPVEYAAPPHPHGGLLQGWSTMPAVALLSPKYANWFQSKPEVP